MLARGNDMARSSWMAVVLCVGVLGCAGKKPEADRQGGAAASASTAGAVPATTAASDAVQALYASCKDRVELPAGPGECQSDADCARAGCGKEVCTTAKAAPAVMTACDDQPCFQVLDSCGCHDGQCSWTLQASAPAPRLPASLPPSPPQP